MPTLLLSALLACTGQTLECSESSMISVFVDEDRDGYGDSSQQRLVCEVGPKEATVGGDCDDTRASVNPMGMEECDGLDNDCDGVVDDNLRELTYYADADGDGFGDALFTQQACTAPPGYVENPWDCDDGDALTYPEATEFCDGKDNSCNGLVDDEDEDIDVETMPTWYLDSDGDGAGDPATSIQACEAPFPNVVANADDCDDADPNRHPGAGEICNMIDDDCDGHLDDSDADIDPAELTTYYYDADKDGYGDASNTLAACDQPWFYVDAPGDCDDAEPALQDESTGWWVLDADGDGFGDIGATPEGPSCTPPTPNHVHTYYATDCDDGNDTVFPGALEVCDGVDNDCDDLIDDEDDTVDATTGTTFYLDTDGDGYGDALAPIDACSLPLGASADATDCDDTRPDVNPGAVEICNGSIDDDCDGLADSNDNSLDPSSIPTWYYDFDLDGWGDPTATTVSCAQPGGFVDNDLDCDDNDNQSGAWLSYIEDADGDGYGAGTPLGPMCTPPAPMGWVVDSGEHDCDDTRFDSYPGGDDICGDGIDQDCDGADASCAEVVADVCADALLEPPYTTGIHFLSASMAMFADDVSWGSTNTCTGSSTEGGDAFVPISLQPGEALYATYISDDDGTLALIPNCEVPSPASCILGGDQASPGGAENLWFFNASAVTRDFYLVLDCEGPTCGYFDLELRIETPASFFQPDTCADASAHEPLVTGGYSVRGRNVAAMNDDIALTSSGCTGHTTLGLEGIFPVELQPGQTIHVDYQQLANDATTYLLSDCNDVNTCVVGADSSGGSFSESMNYTNVSGFTETLFLGLDCWQPVCADYELFVTID